MADLIVIEPGNPWELAEPELQDLRSELVGASPQLQVVIVGERSDGAGVTFIEVLHVFLPSADFVKGAIYTSLLGAIGRHVKRRRAAPKNSNREQLVILYGPDGGPLREVRLPRGASEVVDESPNGTTRPRRLPSPTPEK